MSVEMARTIGKLTARFVATVTRKGRYADGGGLYLAVSDSGSKAWVCRGIGCTALPAEAIRLDLSSKEIGNSSHYNRATA